MSVLLPAVIPAGNTACLLGRWWVPASVITGRKAPSAHFQRCERPSGFGLWTVEIVRLTLIWNKLTGTAGETFFWYVQLWQVEMAWLGSKPNKPTELVFPMNGLIHFNGNVCTHMFACVPACREKRITLLPSPPGLYHTACRHIQSIKSFIRNLRIQGNFNSFVACNSLLATFCLSGRAQEWGHT